MLDLAGRLHVTAGGQIRVLASSDIAEIITVPPCTKLPHGPACLLGLANLRGIVLPVVSLAVLLGEMPREATRRSRVVVLSGASPVGLMVENVVALAADDDNAALDPRALLGGVFGALRRDMSVGAFEAAAQAGQKPETARELHTLIGLEVHGRDYAIRLQEVAEIMRLPNELGTVPGMDDAMLGIVSFRGGVLPLASLAVLLGLNAATSRGVIIVVRAGPGFVGLVVDGVSGSFSLAADAIDRVPRLLARASGEALLEGICRLEGGRKLVGLLDVRRLFNQQTLALLEEAGPQAALPVAQRDVAEDREQFVLFESAGAQYGLPIGAVDEVVRRPEMLARPPFLPDFLLGLLSLRGRTVPVIDMAERFGAKVGRLHGDRVIVVSKGGRQAGLAVDRVCGVLGVPQAALCAAPALMSEAEGLFDRIALQHEGRMVLLVSAAFVLAQAERDLSGASRGRIKAGQSLPS